MIKCQFCVQIENILCIVSCIMLIKATEKIIFFNALFSCLASVLVK